ncbi:MAG: CoA transferase [Thalassobaculum sp.]
MRVGIPIADLTAGPVRLDRHLRRPAGARAESGKGQWVQTSLLQAHDLHAGFPGGALDSWTAKCRSRRATTIRPRIPTGVFTTTDGYINIAVAGQAIWKRFCTAIGRDDLAEHPDFATGELRSANRHALNAIIDEITRTKASEEWVDLFNEAGVPAGPINTIDKVFQDPQIRHLGMQRGIDSPNVGRKIDLVGQPVMLSRTPSEIVVYPPDPGEQTDEILAETGYSEAEIADLRSRNVI